MARLFRLAGHPAAVASLVLLLTAAGTWLTHRDVEHLEASRFDNVQQRISGVILSRMENLAPIISGAINVAGAKDGPTSDSWADYFKAMNPFIRRGVMSIDYVANIGVGSEKTPGASPVQIRLREVRSRYREVRLSSDPWSDSVQREALLRAAESRTAVVSDRITAENVASCDFLLAVALYKEGSDPTPRGGISAIQGWITVLLDAEYIFEGIDGRFDQTIGFNLYAGPAVPEHCLFRSTAAAETPAKGMLRKTTTMLVYDRTWTLEVHALPRFTTLSRNRHRTILVLGGGLLLTAAITGLTWSLSASRDRAHKLALNMTVDLRRAVADTQRAVVSETQEKAKLKFLFDSVPVGIFLKVEGTSGPPLINPSYKAIVGDSQFAPSDLLLAPASSPRPELHAQPEATPPREADHLDGAVEREFKHSDGKAVWAMVNLRIFDDPLLGRRLTIVTLVDITARKAADSKLAKANEQLRTLYRQAGMSEVAASVLHNVGNVLNSANVSISLLADWARESKAQNLGKVVNLLKEHQSELAHFLTEDPRGRHTIAFLHMLAVELETEQTQFIGETESLRKNIDHIKEIVARQQGIARIAGPTEVVALVGLIEEALQLAGQPTSRSCVLERDYQVRPFLSVDRHQALQILVNLMLNAQQACEESGRDDARIQVRIAEAGEHIEITIADNGIGIAPEMLTRIFNHGITTRKDGHGFGLHNSALAAANLGGRLRAESAGPGRGATFILELPRTRESTAPLPSQISENPA